MLPQAREDNRAMYKGKLFIRMVTIHTQICGRGHLHEYGKSCKRCSTKVPLRKCLRKHKNVR